MGSEAMADNYMLNVVCDRKEVFDAAVRLAFSMRYKPVAKFWAVKDGSLILLQWKSESEQANDFPMEVTVDTAIAFCWEWLQQQPYPEEPDHDGSNKKGFWITTTSAAEVGDADCWHKPGGFHGGILRLTPHWCMYGK